MVSRESAFVLNNVVFVSALFAIFLGTVFPLLSQAVVGVQVSVGAPYFNSVMAPLFLLLVFLMGVGPLIAWRRASWDNLKRNFTWPTAASLAVAVGLFAGGIRSFFLLLGFTLCAFAVSTMVFDTFLSLRARRRQAGEGPLRGLGTLIRRNQRRYGGFVVHLGVVLIVLGIAGSMAYSIEREATLNVGETLTAGSYRVAFEGLRGSQQPTHYRVEGTFQVSQNGHALGRLSPTLKFFPAQDSPIGRAVFRSTLKEDLYLILSGFSDVGRNQATLKVLIRPLVMWIWLGGLVIALGTLMTILPLGRAARTEA